MRTAGEILKKTRLEKGISLEEVASKTKIRPKILASLEENDFQKTDQAAFTKGFLKTYAQFLDLNSEEILAIFRRDFDKKEKRKVVLPGMVKPVNGRGFNWSPKVTLIFFSVIFFLGLVGYLVYQYLSLVKRPSLKVIYPPSDLQVKEELIKISGKADPDSLVTINRNAVSLSDQGEFEYKFSLFPGENKIIITATSKLGKKNSIERAIIYQKED
jgi:cytoskeletal protein RodZ